MQATISHGAAREAQTNIQADHRTARILARSMFRDLKDYGVPNDRILEVASELIGLVTDQIREDPHRPLGS